MQKKSRLFLAATALYPVKPTWRSGLPKLPVKIQNSEIKTNLRYDYRAGEPMKSIILTTTLFLTSIIASAAGDQEKVYTIPTELTCSQPDTAGVEKWSFALASNINGNPAQQLLVTVSTEGYSLLVVLVPTEGVVEADGVKTYSIDDGTMIVKIENDTTASFDLAPGQDGHISAAGMTCIPNSTIKFNDIQF